MINYYAKFIPNVATLLYRLLQKDQPWEWSSDCEQAFAESKKCLVNAPMLAHYNPKLPLVLAADASAYGVGPQAAI